MRTLILVLILCITLIACQQEPIQACSREALVCPDGTTVGREGPNCEFAPCPELTADQALAPPVEYMICTDAAQVQFAAQYGFTCVQTCPQGMDEFAGQLGMFCITSYNRATLEALPACQTSATCGDEICAFATHSTDGMAVSWGEPLNEQGLSMQSLRCLPADYTMYLTNTVGLSSVDENGQVSTVIA